MQWATNQSSLQLGFWSSAIGNSDFDTYFLKQVINAPKKEFTDQNKNNQNYHPGHF